jgi:molecular chaperone GrpE
MGAWWRRDRSGEGKRGETMSEHAPEHKATEPRSADQPIDPMPAEGAALEERIGQLVAELEDAKARTLRVMADYHNYQRRSLQNEDAARREGIAAVVASVVPVLDHFDIALSHTGCGEEGAQIMSGVRVIREELLKALAQHGVRVVSPAENDEFEPGKHEADPAGADRPGLSGRVRAGHGPGAPPRQGRRGAARVDGGSTRCRRTSTSAGPADTGLSSSSP